MIGTGIMEPSGLAAEDVLRDELARSDAVLGTIGPILGHLLANRDHSLFSDEIVSRVRGILADLARQLLTAQAGDAVPSTPHAFASEAIDALTDRLAASPDLVSHCHALALEWQVATRLESRGGIDPVLAPLVQELVASDDSATASAAMALVAAQARFMQRQRRMELPLGELPADLFHAALKAWRADAPASDPLDRAESRLRSAYDESANRIGLLERLVTGMGKGARAALSLKHAGVALFVSALASATGQSRDLAIVTTNDGQVARLALALRTAGLKPAEVEAQFAHLHPELALPNEFMTIGSDRASALLAAAAQGGPLT